MPVNWFLAPYARRVGVTRFPARYCTMDDFTAAITADGGSWSEAEVLGNAAIVKVRANTSTLNAIGNDARMRRIPLGLLNDPLSSLTANQRTALRNAVEALGYTAAEIQARFGSDLGGFTLADVLRFICQRRLKPRYDSGTDTIVCDGAAQSCKQPEAIDGEVV